MRSFSELTGRQKLMEIVRWLCVTPVAVLADSALWHLLMSLVQIANYGGLPMRDRSSIAFWFGLVLSYLPPKVAFVFLGAKVAPRRQVATAIVLTVVGISWSLFTHIVGNRIGITNGAHFLAQSAGLLVGTAYIAYNTAQDRRKETIAQRLN